MEAFLNLRYYILLTLIPRVRAIGFAEATGAIQILDLVQLIMIFGIIFFLALKLKALKKAACLALVFCMIDTVKWMFMRTF